MDTGLTYPQDHRIEGTSGGEHRRSDLQPLSGGLVDNANGPVTVKVTGPLRDVARTVRDQPAGPETTRRESRREISLYDVDR